MRVAQAGALIKGLTGQVLTIQADGSVAAQDLPAASAPAAFKASYFVNPAFAGTSTGSASNPFTSIAAAFAYGLAQGVTSAIIFIPPGTNVTENVVFPTSGGPYEISCQANGIVSSSVGARITGSITCDTVGVLYVRLSNISITGNTTGNSPTGTAILLTETAVRQNGSITLTQAGTGVTNLFLRGLGGPGASKQGGSNTGLVSVAGQIYAENWVLEGGISEFSLASFTPYPGSQFQACWFGSTSGSPIPMALNANALNCAFYDCIFVGPTTFTASVANYTIYMDGASLASLNNSIAGCILVGTNLQLKTLNANVSAFTTVAGNVGSTAYGARSPTGLYEVQYSGTLTAAGTAGALQFNVIYTDATGTLTTVAVGATLNIAGAVGSKISGSQVFEHNGAAAPIAYSFTGVVTPGAMAVSHRSAVKRLD